MAIASYRLCSAGETLQRVSPFLLRLGITRLSSQTGLDKIGIPVWCAFAPNARAIVIAQGKGLTDEAAKTSAAMEAIERSVATRPSCTVISASLADLQARGQRHDTLQSLLALCKQPLTETEAIDWVEGRDLVTGDPVWLPFEAVHLDRTEDDRRYWQSSDGLASGNTRDEALFHGLMERVERDALTLWQVASPARRHARRLDPAQIAEPELCQMLERIARADLDIALFDITSDLGLACIVAILAPGHRPAVPPVRHVEVTLGCGAALQPELAASRAISEAVQSRMTFIGGARDDLLPDLFEQTVSAETLQAFAAEPHVALADLPRHAAETATEGLAFLVRHLAERSVTRLYAVDLAPDWLPAAVAKVIVPQLENPDGDRRQRFGMRALSRALS
ncbi:YcaO-like family protein [Affinirhizobium pseudoryzae]|uniref:YcaO-like family protein n=1 Tax=Allorhizobium pseudoryzae TaxID=379684 RepID=UPI001F2D670D|nr:YcaO-like family protein [Allorhizobium pseudoryzae]